MKKTMILISTIFLLILIILSIIYIQKETYISSEEAKQIVLNDISSNNNHKYTFNNIEIIETYNNFVYIITFSDSNNLYSYKINAKNKRILSKKKETITNDLTYMTKDDILKIVLNNANLNKNDCNILFNSIEIENNEPIYITIFYHNNIRYEYKTNPYNGIIISVTKLNEK